MRRILKIILRTALVLFVLINIITAFHAYKFTHFYDAGNSVETSGSKSTWQVTKEIFFGIKAMKKKNIAADSNFKVVTLTTANKIDLEGWYSTVDSGKGEKKIVLWGISMGAAAITKSIHDYKLQPEKIILEMPFASILDAAESRIRLMHIPAEPLATLVTFWGGVENGFWAFKMKPSVYARDITAPVLLQWGKNDPRVSQAETDLIYNNISTPKKLVVYELSGHESLCKKENEKWISSVSAFLP